MATKLIASVSQTITSIKGDLTNTLTATEEQILQHISSTHAPDGSQLDVKSLLAVTSNILNRSTQTLDGVATGTQAHLENVEDKPFQPDFDPPTGTIDKISCEIMCSCKASGKVNLHESALSIFTKLSSYSWDAKAVVALAALAVNFGDLWLLVDIHGSNPVAKHIAFLKKLPLLLKPTPGQKNRLNALNSLTKVVLQVTECIVEIEKLSVKHSAKDVPTLAKAMADLPLSVYLTIKSVVACAIHISTLTTITDETQLSVDLNSLAPKLNMTLSKLKDFLVDIKRSIEENKRYQMLLKLLVTHTDNVEVLKALIFAKDDLLIDLSTKRTVKIDHLRRKNVLLFISDLEISIEELTIIKETYNSCKTQPQPTKAGPFHVTIPFLQPGTSHETMYEVVWIPIVEQWTEEAHKKFESLKAEMPWYTVHELVTVDKAVLKFFRQEWHLKAKPIVVVLNSQGKVECEDAFHMIKVWGSKAFPFSDTKEKELWQSQKWGLELLLEGIHPQLQTWVKENKYVLLYGGDDQAWVQKLEESAKHVMKEAGITIEFINMGKTSKDTGVMKRFWTRIESLVFSKIRREHEELDEVSQEIQKLYGYKKEGKWAVLCRGSKVIMSGHGDTIVEVLSHQNLKETIVTEKGDVEAAVSQVHQEVTASDPGCCHFRFPTSAGKVPETLKCPKCPRVMERYTAFQCCHKDEGTMNGPNC